MSQQPTNSPFSDVALSHAIGPDGRMISVDDVPSGIACGCVCPGCGRPLVAKKGEINAHHFAHASETKCTTGFESMAHLLAKQIIADAKCIELPELVASWANVHRVLGRPVRLEFDKVELEVWEDGIRPDIIGTARDERLCIEIFVTHASEPKKVDVLRSRRASAIEIDLSRFRGGLDFKEFEHAVLWEAPRHWLHNERQVAAETKLRAEYEAKQAEGIRKRKEARDRESEYQRLWVERQARDEAEEAAREAEEIAREAQDQERRRLVQVAAIAEAEKLVGPDVRAFVLAMEIRLLEAAVKALGDAAAAQWFGEINPRRTLLFQSQSWAWLISYEKSCHKMLRHKVFREAA